MYPVWLTVISLSVGQAGPQYAPPGGAVPAAWPQSQQTAAPDAFTGYGIAQAQAAAQPAATTPPAPLNVTVNVPPPPPAAPAAAAAAAVPPDRWGLMQSLQGTWFGAALDDNRTSISGWTEGPSPPAPRG